MISRTIADAAIQALEKIGMPANLGDIYSCIVRNHLYSFGAKNPLSVLRVTLDRHCINKNLSSMHQKRLFKKLIDGKYELSPPTWMEECFYNMDERNKVYEVENSLKEILFLAKVQRDKVRKEIVTSLRNLSPEQFEDFCRIFLSKYGFLEMTLTRRGRDGGIDVTGRLKIGLASMRVAVQCKKYAEDNKVGRNSVSAFRGDITGDFEQGIFITTSSYSKEAESVSFKPACIPIVLIDGEQLADFMIEKRIGVQHQLIELYKFEKDLIWE